jgi:hypothetical protein
VSDNPQRLTRFDSDGARDAVGPLVREPATVFLALTHSFEGGDVRVFATAELRDHYAAALPDDVRERTELIDAWPLDAAGTAGEIASWTS